MSETIEIKVPDIGDFTDVDIIEVFVAVGDVVEVDQALMTLETDKASMEIPATEAGTVQELFVSVGGKASEGMTILTLNTGASASAPAPAAAPAEAPAASPAPAAAASQTVEVRVPDIGDFSDVDIIEVSVQVGDTVELDQGLITLETDKASMEIPATAAGVIQSLAVSVGGTASEGDLVAVIAAAGATTAAAPAAVSAPAPVASAPAAPVAAKPAAPSPAPAAAPVSGKLVHASPSVRRFARDLGVEISRITQATGPKGRILREDVQAFVKGVMSGSAPGAAAAPVGSGIPPIPAVDFSKFGEIEERPLSKIKRLTGVNLSRAWLNLPMVTHHDLADITEMEKFRKSLKADAEKHGVKVTFLLFVMKALVAAMKQQPEFNASLSADGESLILKKYFNIGVAVDTPNGLVVPVFRDVDKKNIYDLAAEMGVVSAKAREGKLMPKDMSGGCMTISSLGGIGGTAFTPIVNAPEVAILGVTRADIQPVWDGESFKPRLMLPLDLTYDHRVIDGAAAARFVVTLAGYLNDIRRVLL